jgi:peptidoglycan/xylan/chitin deacetylase (PgdA/CDA1 family)
MEISFEKKIEVVTYHYVLPDELTRERTLNETTFIRQLDFFEQSGGIITRDEWLSYVGNKKIPKNKFLLTFDDGLACHFDVVAPILHSKSLFAIFFISSGIFDEKFMPLDVHVLHFLLQNFDVTKVFQTYTGHLKQESIVETNLTKSDSIYQTELNPLVNWLKRKVNYEAKTNDGQTALQKTYAELSGADLSDFKNKWYMNLDQIKGLVSLNFAIGGHTRSHKLLPLIPQNQLYEEIDYDKKTLDSVLEQDIHAFAYPFGGPTSFNPHIVSRVKEAGYKVAFTTIKEDFTDKRFQSVRNLLLPRKDCNDFNF